MKDKQALMRIQTNQQLSDIKNVPKRNKTTKKKRKRSNISLHTKPPEITITNELAF